MSDALVVFTPSGKRGRFALGTPVLTAARQLGVDIDSVCGGRAICGRCQVTVGEGSFAKHGITSTAEHLTAFSAIEQRYRGRKGLQPGRRLSCQAQLLGDVVIDVPAGQPGAPAGGQEARRGARDRARYAHPAALRRGRGAGHAPAARRLRAGARRRCRRSGGSGLTIDLGPLRELQKALRKGGWKVTVAVHKGERIVACWPGFHDTLLGIAVDIGSTTIAAHLCDLATGEVLASSGMMNPQIRFGEDLMSRVSYAMMNPGGEAEMTAAVRTAWTRWWASSAPRQGRPARRAGAGVRRQPDHAPPAARHRPGRAGRGAVRARDRQRARAAGARARPARRQPGRAGLRPALHRRAMSARTAPASSSPRRPTSTTRSRCWSMSAPTPRSCSATRTGCSPAPRRPARPSRGRRSATASARHRGRSSGCGSTGRRWSRASR